MNILLLSAGGGGGNILRSVKALFRRDLIVTEKSDAKYADRLRRAVTTRFLDTNEFSLADLPVEERLLIGAATTRRFGSRHNPELARAALEESRAEVERLVSRYSVVIIIASGGKGTGAGTVFPLAEMVRQQRKLVIPVFVRPSFERHEVEKQKYDQALGITEQFDAAKIRLIEILNDRGYLAADPQPQAVVWERMNRPIARGLRGLLYVLSDLSQVDPSDLSALFAGEGRLRMGFAEIDPTPACEPNDEDVDAAAQACWENSYFAFREPVGTSLICIQGGWSNLVDARIKSRLASLAIGQSGEHPYNPLYARAGAIAKPWGVTGIFAEYTGQHAPLELDWTLPHRVSRTDRRPNLAEATSHPHEIDTVAPTAAPRSDAPAVVVRGAEPEVGTSRPDRFSTLWEFAVALNRQDPTAIAIAREGTEQGIAIDEADLRKLLATVWFRSIFPQFSAAWRERLLSILTEGVVIPNHAVGHGRRARPLKELGHAEIKEVFGTSFVPEKLRSDLQLLLTVGQLWGADALKRFRFSDLSPIDGSSRLGALLQSFRA